MKSEAQAIVAYTIPVFARERIAVQPRKIPLAAKVTITIFLAVLVLTVAGMWLESSLLIGMCAVGILLPQCLWLADFGSNLLGFHFLGLTSYMFDSHLPLFTRG